MISFLSMEALRPKAAACVQKYLSLSGKHALAIGLYHRGALYLLGRAPDGPSPQYPIGSISKTMTAHLILCLQEGGMLDLERGVDAYLTLPAGRYPTVYELLTHTAGYTHATPIEITLPGVLCHSLPGKNIYENCTARTVLKSLAARRNAPTGKYAYSDFSYAVLALVAEAVTATPFAALLEQFLQTRLGLSDTAIFAAPDEHTLTGVRGKRTVLPWKWYRTNPYVAGGGVVSTVEDMLRYISLQIESDEPYIEQAHRVCESTLSPKRHDAMCLGWHTYPNSNLLWHIGAVGAFHSSVIFHKPKRLGVVVLTNARGTSRANAHYLAKMLCGELKSNKIDFTRKETL